MTILTWPADLPGRVRAEGFSEGLGDGRLKTATDAGPPKLRRRFSRVPRPVAASVTVTVDQKARLARFWDEVGGGALPFLIPDPTMDGAPLADADGRLLTDEAGRPLINAAWWLVVFGDQPPTFTPQQRGMRYVAAFSLTVLP